MRFGNILVFNPRRAGIASVVRRLQDHYGFTKADVDSIGWLDAEVMAECGYEFHKDTQMWIARGYDERGNEIAALPQEDR